MDQLGILFNGGVEPLYNALNNNLTFGENFNATVTTFNIAVGADGTPQNATSFKLNSYQSTFSGILVLDAFGASDSTINPTSGVFVRAIKNGNNVNISNIKGLTAGVNYTLKVVALG